MDITIVKKNQIITERLVLKPYCFSDQGPLMGLLKNKVISETFMIPDFQTDAQFSQLAEKLIRYSQCDDRKHLEYGVYLNGRLIGFMNDCGFDNEKIEIGYVIHPDDQGRGYATEALRAIMEELREMGFKKVVAAFFEGNEASLRVMQKCGMKLSDRTEELVYRGKKRRCRYCEINLSDQAL